MQLIRHLARDRRGVAFVEFALALPLLVTAVFMGLETAWLVLQQQTVGRVAAQTADNVARIRDSIDETDLAEVLAAARLNSDRIGSLAASRIVISSVQLNAKGTGQWIRWQRCMGGLSGGSAYGVEGRGRDDASLPAITAAGRTIRATPGMAIILVEMKHAYRPLVSNRMFGDRMLTTETAYVVRQRNDLGINNATGMADADKQRC